MPYFSQNFTYFIEETEIPEEEKKQKEVKLTEEEKKQKEERLEEAKNHYLVPEAISKELLVLDKNGNFSIDFFSEH